ncbi:MAG TPA: sensor domain-containing phosphodiesterase [Gemmatimonadaceae bacterium]
MPSERRHLVATVSAVLLTVGAGSLVGGAATDQAWLAVAGAVVLMGASVMLTHSLGGPVPPPASPGPEPPRLADGPPVAVSLPLLEQLSDPVLLVDRHGAIRRASVSTARFLGHDPHELVGRPLGRLLHEDDIDSVSPFLLDIAQGGDGTPAPRWRVRRADGTWHAVRARATSLLDEPGIEGIALVLCDDVVERTLADLPGEPPLRDALTGLASRALFRDRVEHALARASRRQQPLAVVLLEFDEFRCGGRKATYEELEQLLTVAATRIQTCLRSSDSAGRIEGMRFALLLEDLEENRQVARVTERLARLFASSVPVQGHEFVASGNIGIASASPGDGVDDLLRNVDVALRAARRRGRGAVELYDARQHPAALEHDHLLDDLRLALDAGQLSLRYQPIVILRSRRIAGVETLVRWQHPDRGIIPAAAFIPVAEESGLIVPLGRWVLREACHQLARWLEDIGPGRSLTVTVNLTARQLLDPGFVDDVRDAIGSSGIEPGHLVFEVSEQVFARGLTDLLRRVREVRALGVRFAIDDFGSRSATLGDPADIPVDIIKIDQMYISQLTRRPEDHAATRAIVALGRLKQLRTVAPGVEQEDQLGELLRFRCEYGQGTLFSEPLEAGELLQLLRRD